MNYRRYRHELKVILSLKLIWGTYVPKLLLKMPNKYRLALGSQLCDQMSENFIHDWSSEEQMQARDAFRRVMDCGWKQADGRGCNYVRLPGSWPGDPTSIAIIDFESFVKVRKRKERDKKKRKDKKSKEKKPRESKHEVKEDPSA